MRLIGLLPLLLCLGLAHAADMAKTLHVQIKKSETGIDPATASDFNTLSVVENLFDPLLRYDYLARPVQLKPNTLAAMPEVDASKTLYTFHIQPGIRFTPDTAFGARPRELTAADYVYSFMRLMDPAVKSPWRFIFDGKLAELRATERYTLQIRLKEPDANFLFELAMPATSAVAREAVEAYPAGQHPVGTGPYLLKTWQHGEKIVLDANPDFRPTVFDDNAATDPDGQAIARRLAGKHLPLIGHIEIKVVEEQQAQMLSFLSGQFDYLEQIPPPLANMALADGNALRPELAQKGMRLSLFTPLHTYYMWMNMDDPVLGGMAPQRIALRRAIVMAYNREEDIRVLEHGLAVPAQSPVPPAARGHDPAFRSAARYDPALARALLDRFGYRIRPGDTYRSQPDGKPLLLTMHTQASTTGRLRDEMWLRSLNAIGIQVAFKADTYTEIIKASRLGQVQMFETDWLGDIPDGENFLQLLYGPNRTGVNYSRFSLAQYDALFEAARKLDDGPERTRMYDRMARLIDDYAPWVVRVHPLSADLRQPWLANYERHPVMFTNWRYLDLDAHR
ncbi:MAG TPA: ABC transporter substrate-binding protein [Burkholderiaceae bacterium]